MKKTISRLAWGVGLTGFLLCSDLAYSGIIVSRQPVAKLSVPNAEAIPTKRYSQGDPTDNEQYLLEITNRCRANPLADIRRIIRSSDSHIQSAFKSFDVNVTQLETDFAAYASKPPLAFNAELIASARAHNTNMALYDYQGHGDYDGGPITLAQRLIDAGYTDYYYGGENVYAYAYSPWHAHAAFLVDWGVEDLGHRILLLGLDDATVFREIGIGITPENNAGTVVGPLLVTEEFGYRNSQVVFITGVAYYDFNGNDFYDPGEGLENVQVMPDHGEYYAATSASGGFTIPVATNSGTYIITASGSTIPTMSASVQILEENVKLDFQIGILQTATIEGTVLNAASNIPLANVVMTLSPGGQTETTDSQGAFTFEQLDAGSYSLTAKREGYSFQPSEVNITLAARQTFKTQLTATPQTNSDNPPSSDTTTDNDIDSAVGCFSPAISLIAMLPMGFLGLSVSAGPRKH